MPKTITVKNSPEFRTHADVLNYLGLHTQDGTEYVQYQPAARSLPSVDGIREVCFMSLNKPDETGLDWDNSLSGDTLVEKEPARGMNDKKKARWEKLAREMAANPPRRVVFGKEGASWTFLGEFEISEASLKGHPWTLVWKRVADTLDLPLAR